MNVADALKLAREAKERALPQQHDGRFPNRVALVRAALVSAADVPALCEAVEGLAAVISTLTTAIWGEPQPDATFEETRRQAVDQRVAFDCIDDVRAENAQLRREIELCSGSCRLPEDVP